MNWEKLSQISQLFVELTAQPFFVSAEDEAEFNIWCDMVAATAAAMKKKAAAGPPADPSMN